MLNSLQTVLSAAGALSCRGKIVKMLAKTSDTAMSPSPSGDARETNYLSFYAKT